MTLTFDTKINRLLQIHFPYNFHLDNINFPSNLARETHAAIWKTFSQYFLITVTGTLTITLTPNQFPFKQAGRTQITIRTPFLKIFSNFINIDLKINI